MPRLEFEWVYIKVCRVGPGMELRFDTAKQELYVLSKKEEEKPFRCM